MTDSTVDADTPSGLLRIGEVADRVGLSLRTVRYYEEQGLLVPETRSAGGFRLYAAEQVERLGLIMQMKPLGFSVQEMRELLDARDLVRGAQDEKTRSQAREAVAAFAEAAAERHAKLTERLRQAEGLADRLRADAAQR